MPTTILRLIDARGDRDALIGALDAIFYETAPLAPAQEPARAEFHDLWLGQYLRHEPELCWVALDSGGNVTGYLVGCWDNPVGSPRFSRLDYFDTFAEAVARYPAHLHINLTVAARGKGLGAQLVARFAAATEHQGLPGLHVVTGAGMRNLRFYERIGFRRIASTRRGGGEVVFLGHDLTASQRA